ncbi:MAG: hypothetical protein AAFR15_19555 [Cyanobacteria bacterium J06627_15]
MLAPVYDGNADATFPAIEPEGALRHGPTPTLLVAESGVKAVNAAVRRVSTLCESGYSPSDIAILYRWKSRKEAAAFESLIEQLRALGVSPYWVTANQQAKRNYSANQPGVRIVTALSSLGLEFKVVLILWLEQFTDCCHPDAEVAALARRQLHVAMTRAQEELHIIGGKTCRIGSTLNQVDTLQTDDRSHQSNRQPVKV